MDNPNQLATDKEIADQIADLDREIADQIADLGATIKMEMKTSTGKVITEYFELSSGKSCWIVERGDVLS